VLNAIKNDDADDVDVYDEDVDDDDVEVDDDVCDKGSWCWLSGQSHVSPPPPIIINVYVVRPNQLNNCFVVQPGACVRVSLSPFRLSFVRFAFVRSSRVRLAFDARCSTVVVHDVISHVQHEFE
jgi:hypothetical protein